jgi:small subunit ribosomal protein S7
MPRSGRVRKRTIEGDPIYGNRKVARLINRVMKDGKKKTAQKHVYSALKTVKKKLKVDNPVEVLLTAMENIKPNMEVRTRRVGGAAYQVPMPVKGRRKQSLAIRWLIKSAQKRPNKQYPVFSQKLAAEIMDAYNNKGGAVDKKRETHRIAESNKAFSHFRW